MDAKWIEHESRAGVIHAGDRSAWGHWMPGNVLDAGWALPQEMDGSERVVAWSGTVAEGMFEADPRTWGPRGQEGLKARCDGLMHELVERGITLAMRPHARHVLGDAHRCALFLAWREGQPFELVLDPASLLTAGMLEKSEDHLIRIFEILGGRPGVCGVVLANVRAPSDEAGEPGGGPDAGPPLELCSLHGAGGVLDAGLIERLCVEHVPAGVPVFRVGDGGAGGVEAR
ncbi:MAG: hypothetical protein ACREJO_18250 [Phycisphaerales bacterium]